MSQGQEPIKEKPMTLADVDAALKAEEITPQHAEDLRVEIRVRDHSMRFRNAAKRLGGAS